MATSYVDRRARNFFQDAIHMERSRANLLSRLKAGERVWTEPAMVEVICCCSDCGYDFELRQVLFFMDGIGVVYDEYCTCQCCDGEHDQADYARVVLCC